MTRKQTTFRVMLVVIGFYCLYFVTCILLNGCAFLNNKGIKLIDEVESKTKMISAAVEPAFAAWCNMAIDRCIASKDTACPELKKCQKMRDNAINAIIGVHQSVSAVSEALR